MAIDVCRSDDMIVHPVDKMDFANRVSLFSGVVKDFQDISDIGSHARNGDRISVAIRSKLPELKHAVERLENSSTDSSSLLSLCELLFVVLSMLENTGADSVDALQMVAERADKDIFGKNPESM